MAVPTPDAGAGASAGSVRPANPLDQLTGSLTGTRNPTPAGTSTPRPAPAPAKKAPAKKAAPRKTTTASRSRPLATAPSGMTVDAFLGGIKQYESGGNYTAQPKNPKVSTASGAYQYLDSTWNNYGGYAHAWQAPQSVQDARARADTQARLKKYGGDWRKVAAAHFAGEGWVDKHPDPATWDQNPVPGSNNPTVSQYVATVFKNAGMATDSQGHPVPQTSASTSTASTVAGTDGALPANATPKQINDYVAKHYGYLAAFLADPQIGPILRKAALNDWSEEDLTGAVTATNWWKTHSDSMREWDSLNRLDPAKAKGQLTSMMATLRAQATSSGVTLVGLQLHDMAVNALRFGWNAAQIGEALRAQGKQTTTGAQTQFGPYAALAASNPDVKSVLDQAVRAGWSQQQFETALAQTNWWKTTNSTARQVQLGQVSDPATTGQQQTVRHDQVVQLARNLGLPEGDPNVAKIAQDAFTNGWDDQTVQRKLADLVHVNPDGNSGQTAVTVGQLQQQANAYMIKLSDPTVQDWTQRILRGDTTTAAFDEYLKQQAKIQRPWASKQIDAGLTMEQITDWAKQLVASTLEVSPDSVDFTNPRYAPLLDGNPQQGATGTDSHGPMSLSQAGAYLRGLDAYKQTAQAKQQAADFTTSLLKDFGKLAV